LKWKSHVMHCDDVRSQFEQLRRALDVDASAGLPEAAWRKKDESTACMHWGRAPLV